MTPPGPYTAEQWARLLNLPEYRIRVGSVVTPFGGGGQSITFVAWKEASCAFSVFSLDWCF